MSHDKFLEASGGGYTPQKFKTNKTNWLDRFKAYNSDEMQKVSTYFSNVLSAMEDANEAIENSGIEGISKINLAFDYSDIAEVEEKRENLSDFSAGVYDDAEKLIEDPFHVRIYELMRSTQEHKTMPVTYMGNTVEIPFEHSSPQSIFAWMMYSVENTDIDDILYTGDERKDEIIREYMTYDMRTGTYGFESALENWDNLNPYRQGILAHCYEYSYRQYEMVMDENSYGAKEKHDIVQRMANKFIEHKDYGPYSPYASGGETTVSSAGKGMLGILSDDSRGKFFVEKLNQRKRMPYGMTIEVEHDRAATVFSFGKIKYGEHSTKNVIAYCTDIHRSVAYVSHEAERSPGCYNVQEEAGLDKEFIARMINCAENEYDMDVLERLSKSTSNYNDMLDVDPDLLSNTCKEMIVIRQLALTENWTKNKNGTARREAAAFNHFRMDNLGRYSSKYNEIYLTQVAAFEDNEQKNVSKLEAFGRGAENNALLIPRALTNLCIKLDSDKAQSVDIRNIDERLKLYEEKISEKERNYHEDPLSPLCEMVNPSDENSNYLKLHRPYLPDDELEDLKNIYYSYATYCKDQSAELLITDEMLNKLDAIRKLLERADVQYLMESGYTEENEKIDLARNQHPKWFKGGEIASDAVLYWALAPEIGAERVLGKKTFEEAAKTFGKNVAKGMALDVAIKDIPAATLSFASGQDIDTVLYNFGGALEADLVGNSIGEFVGIGFDAALSAVKSTIRESASETFESSCKTAQSAVNELEEIALEKNIDNIPTDNTEKIDIFAEKSGVGDASKAAKQGNSGDATQKIAYSDKAGSLLPAEGKIGSYKELIKQGKRGDNITPHHMPSCEYANKMGVSKNDGLCMNMEMYYPGKGGRHRLTYTYGNNMTNIQKQMYYELSPRDALTFDLKDIKRIYMQQGLYDDIRPQIREYIDESMRRWPNIYEK